MLDRDLLDTVRAKLDILKLKANDHDWQCYVPQNVKNELEEVLLLLDRSLAEKGISQDADNLELIHYTYIGAGHNHGQLIKVRKNSPEDIQNLKFNEIYARIEK